LTLDRSDQRQRKNEHRATNWIRLVTTATTIIFIHIVTTILVHATITHEEKKVSTAAPILLQSQNKLPYPNDILALLYDIDTADAMSIDECTSGVD
jgi:uncharacterized membrane protein